MALWANAFYKSTCQSMCLCVCLSVHFWGTFKRLSAPTSWSRMSKVFIDSQSLGKRDGKKWSQIWKLSLIQGVKSLPFLGGEGFLPYLAGFLWYWCFLLLITVFLPPLHKVQCANFLDYQNPWGGKMERSGLRFENFAHKRCKIAVAKKVFFFPFFFICSLS